jgi:high-affinity iron transporter
LFPAFLLTLREALEAVLIIGIVSTTLRTTQRTSQQRYVWAGTVAGILLSVVIALALNLFGTQLEGIAEEIFEGTMMFLAAMVLTWMIFWMQNQSSQLSQQLRQQVKNADQEKRGFPLFSIAFLAIFREGLELSLFLTAASFDREQTGILTGFLIGMGVAIILGWALTRGLLRLNIRRFFLITSFLLILVAGGLVAHAIHEFNEIGWIPAIVEHVWDLNPWFDEKSLPGQLMTSLFGYNANPSLSEVMGSTAYFGGLLYILYRRRRERPPIHPPPPHENQIGL